jgi:hypothetical protein
MKKHRSVFILSCPRSNSLCLSMYDGGATLFTDLRTWAVEGPAFLTVATRNDFRFDFALTPPAARATVSAHVFSLWLSQERAHATMETVAWVQFPSQFAPVHHPTRKLSRSRRRNRCVFKLIRNRPPLARRASRESVRRRERRAGAGHWGRRERLVAGERRGHLGHRAVAGRRERREHLGGAVHRERREHRVGVVRRERREHRRRHNPSAPHTAKDQPYRKDTSSSRRHR